MKKNFTHFLLATAITFIGMFANEKSWGQVNHLVISQVYGGGNNSGATYQNDFVEIFNPTGSSVSLTNWSVQYASGSSTSGSASVTNLSGTIGAGKYLLIQEAGGTTNGVVLPTPDISGGVINLSATAGKVWLCNSTTALTISSSGAPTSSTSVVDLVGFGAANYYEGTAATSAPSNTTSVKRASNGCTDANQNSTDFSVVTPSARNSSTAANYCYPTKFVVSSISPTTPSVGNTFSVTVQAQDAGNNLNNVLSNTSFTLSNTNGGTIGGTTTGTINAGSNSVTISGVTLSASGSNNVTLTATRTSGDNLSVGTSSTFSVNTSSPILATPTFSSITASGATLNETATSDGGASISSYSFEYSTTSGFANGAGTSVSSSNLSSLTYSAGVSSLSVSTTYYVHAIATNSVGTSYSAQGSFTTIAACGIPQSVGASSITGTTATISWSAPSAGTPTDYEYVCSTNNSTPTGSGTSTSGATSVGLTSLSQATTYYVFVRTNCGSGNYSSWTSVYSFSTTQPTPTISSISATHQYVGGTISISGNNLQYISTVQVGSTTVSALNWSYNGTSTNINLTIDDSYTSGQITVTNGSGGSDISAATFSNDGYISVANGNYNSNATWQGNTAPATTLPITIANNVTLSANVSNNPSSININGGATFDLANYTLTSSGAVSNNGTLQFSARGILTLGSGANLANTNTFTAGNGKIILSGSNTVTGSFTFNNVNVNSASVDFGSASSISDSLMMNSSSSLINNSPTYTSTSTLVYANTMTAGLEWASGVTSGAGVPYKVSIASGNTLTLGASTYRQIQSNLSNSGTLILSSSNDLKVAGNWSGSGTFTAGGRTVTFNGATQSISSATTFAGLTIENSSSTTISANTVISSALTINSSGYLTLSGSSTFNITGCIGTINGTFENKSSGSFTVSSGTATAFAINGTYIHNNTAGSSTFLGKCTFNTGSTMLFKQTGSIAPSLGSNGKIFYNLDFEASSGTYTATPSSSTAVTVNGDLTIGSNVTLNPTFTSTGAFAVGGSVLINGISSSSNVLTLNGVSKTIGGGGTLNFASVAVSPSASYTVNNSFSVATSAVVNGTLMMGNNIISGAGTFTLSSGGTLGIGNAAGITSSGATGNVQTTGTRSFAASNFGNFIYNGTAAQHTGNGLPTTINSLTINNSAGDTLDVSPTINGNLNFNGGNFIANGNTITMASSAASNAISGNSSSSYFANGNFIWNGINGTNRVFPIGTSGSYLPVEINNGSGANFTAGVAKPIANAVFDATKVVNAQWSILSSSTVTSATVKFQWNSADEATSFNGASNCELGRWTGASPYNIEATGLAVSLHSITATGLTNFSSGANIYVVGNVGDVAQPVVTPIINSFAPTAGYGGSSVVITGSNFLGVSQVKMGGNPVTVTYNNGNDSLIILANGSGGQIIVKNSAGSDTTNALSPSVYTSSGYITQQNGDWNTSSTWLGGTIPQIGSVVIINHAVTISASVVSTMSDVTINSGSSITTSNSSAALSCSNVNINGTLDMTNGGTFSLSNGSTFSNNNTFTCGAGKIVFSGAGTISNNATTFNNIDVSGTLNPGTSTTINGILQLLSTGSVGSHSPTFGSASTLIYANNSSVTPNTEWVAGSSSGAGVPNHVTINNNTTFSFPSSSNFYQMNGDLNVATGSFFALSTQSGGDLKIKGNWTCSGTFTPNTRTVYFNGTTQSINSGNIFPFIEIVSPAAVTINTTGLNISANGSSSSPDLIVDSLATLNIASGKSIFLNSGAYAKIGGTVVNSGTFSNSNSSTGYLVYSAGALYQHTVDNYTIPFYGTWNTGSTFEMKGLVAATSPSSGFNQSFANFIWNCTSQTANTNLSGILNTVNGDFTVKSTGTSGTGSLRLTASANVNLKIGGNYLQQGGKVDATSGAGKDTINLSGNFSITAGTFVRSGSGTATINFVKTSGSQNFSSTTTGINTNSIAFNVGDGSTTTNKLILGSSCFMATGSAFSVNNGSTVACGIDTIKQSSGSSTFTLNSGATIESGSALGVNGSVQTSSHTFNAGANYTFNGAVNQATGSNLPSTVNTLTINNSASGGVVSLTNAAVTTAALNLLGGYFEVLASKNLSFPTSGSIVTNNGGDFASTAVGTINFAGSNTVSGSVNFYPNVNINGTVDFGGASTIQNFMTINNGGSLINNSPFYNTASTLQYNQGGAIDRSIEWNSNSGAGYAANVQISNSTTFNVSGGAPSTARNCAGGLTIDNGSTFTMNKSGDQMTAPFTFGGNLINNGTLELSGVAGGDLNINGNWTRASGATFTPHHRKVTFGGSTPQTITATGAAAETFDAFAINNTSSMATANTGVLMAVGNNLVINDSLILTHGKLNVGTGEAQMMDTLVNAISGYTAISSNPSSSNSFVVGTLRRKISTTTAAYDFPLGTDANQYEVAQINVNSNSNVDNLKAKFYQFDSNCSYAANKPTFNAPPPSNAGVHVSAIVDMLNYGYYIVEPYDNLDSLITSPTINYDAQMAFNGHSNGAVGSTALGAKCYTLIKQPSCGSNAWSLGGGTYNSTMQMAASSPTNTTTVTLKLFGLGSFSQFDGGFNPDEVLPIELLDFTVQQNGNDALLNWSTASETNNDEFDVERSVDGISFQKIGAVKSKGETANDYAYTDANIAAQNSTLLYYRLRQVDFNGDFTYSPVRALLLNNNNANPFAVEGLYPNPFSDAVTAKIILNDAATINYQLFDLKGTMVLQQTLQANKGENSVNISGLTGLAAGTYLLKINGNGNSFNSQLQKQ